MPTKPFRFVCYQRPSQSAPLYFVVVDASGVRLWSPDMTPCAMSNVAGAKAAMLIFSLEDLYVGGGDLTDSDMLRALRTFCPHLLWSYA